MPYKKMLLATDGSDHALQAAAQAAQLAKDMGAEVEILGIAVIQSMYGGMHMGAIGVSGMEQEVERAATAAVQDTAAVFIEAGLSPKSVVSVAMGSAAGAICQEAEDIGADLIVIGSRGLGRAGSLLVGSTSRDVLSHAKIPVLVVK
jgi:nucleotide-binding universal stress UspA family protein